MINLNKILLTAAVALGVCNASATVLFTENFDYTAGIELNTQGKWVTYGSNPNDPITVSDNALTFFGYQNAGKGGAAYLKNAQTSGQDLQAPLTEKIAEGSVYMSALVNVEEVSGTTNYVLSFNAPTATAEIVVGKSTTNTWRLHLVKSDAEGKFKFGISKNTNSVPKADATTDDYDLNTTYLVIMKYTFVDGSSNDEFSLYIDTVNSTEPSTPTITVNSGTDVNTSFGIGGIGINQTGTATRLSPTLTIDAIRVATTWAELFDASASAGSEDDSTEKLASSRAIQSISLIDADAVYKYTGTATVTFIDSNTKRFYAQDNLGGICFSFENDAPCAVGDKITNVTGSLFQEKYEDDSYNVFKATALQVSSSNNSYEPSETDLKTLSSEPAYYMFRLVRLSGVTITPNESGKFDTSNFTITQGEKTGILAPLAGTNVVGATIPTDAVDIVGISRSYLYNIVSPRSMADITEVTSFNVTTTYAHNGNDLVPINTPTEVIKLKVEAKNLPKAIDLEVTGTGSAAYSVSPTTIPEGTSTTDVVVTFTPTKTAKYSGYLYFDSYDGSKSFTYAGYDPKNPPSISADTSELNEFSAAPGETDKQTIYVTTANLIDYATVKVMGEGGGTFRLGTTMLYLKNGTNQLSITFAPTAPGEYKERIEISSFGAETQYVTLTGMCIGTSDPGEAEGDSFDLSMKNPLSYMYEKFDNVEKNKPLSVSGWTNVATEGTRAWWGYTFDDDDNNNAAKVTAYDSKVATGQGEPCVMTLVTPALDSANSGSKILTFRVMGQNLTDDMTDKLEIMYMDFADGTFYSYVFDSNSIDLPDTEDESGEWQDYIVDFDGQQIADTFFIGFRFTSTRGIDNSAVYYIDDVTWGRTDVPQIKPAKTEVESFAMANQDIKFDLTIHALNLTGDITMTMGGNNPSKFSLDKTTLPSTGGNVTVTFNSDIAGTHTAYLILSSEGAANAYVSFDINNFVDEDGVSVISADAKGVFNVFNTLGVKVLTTTNADDLSKLSPGLYIVNGKKLSIK